MRLSPVVEREGRKSTAAILGALNRGCTTFPQQPAPPLESGFVQLFVEVPDIETCIATATRLGATVIVPKSVLPDGNAMAVLLDPTGLSFAICTLRRDRSLTPATRT
jgi:predicted enzyme related to lactoylglutathione lyase